MIWIDIAIVAVIAISAIIGLFRGFLKEAIGLATWILAFYLAFIMADPAADYLRQWIHVDTARLAIAFAIIFFIVLVAGGLVNFFMSRLVSQTGLAGTDSVIGIIFGTLRGIAVLIVLVMLGGLTPLPGDSWWQQSLFMPTLESGALWARDYLPEDIAKAIHYPGDESAQSDSDHNIH